MPRAMLEARLNNTYVIYQEEYNNVLKNIQVGN